MSDQGEAQVVETGPVDDIRGDIHAAMKSLEAGSASTAPAIPDPVEKPQAQPETPRADGRDATGRFAAKTPDPAQTATPAVPDPNAPAQATPSPVTAKAPRNWAAHMHDVFSKLPPEAQAYIAQREDESHHKITAQDEDRNFGKRIRELATPYQAIITAEGATPEKAFENYLNTAYVLRTGSAQQKRMALQSIAQQFSVDLGVPLQQGAAPVSTGLSQEDAARLVQAELAKERQRQDGARIQETIETFAAESGHEHFETVKPIMSALLTSGAAKGLQDAYDQACQAHPEIGSTLIAARVAAEQQKRSQDLQQQVGAAKRAAVSVKGGPGAIMPNGASTPDRSLRDELRANLAAAKGGIN